MLRLLTYLSTKTMCIAYAIAQINVKMFPKIWEKSVIEIKTIPTNPKMEYT